MIFIYEGGGKGKKTSKLAMANQMFFDLVDDRFCPFFSPKPFVV
jgi:hypothetical protein